MQLEENMYVRTKYGIFKIRKITKDLAYWKHEKRVIELDRNIPEYNYRFSFYKDESIFKGAKFKDNIIDLIEVGDYVNGCYVSNKRASVNEHLGRHPKGIGIIKCNAYFNQGNYDDCKFEWIEEKDIKSIVTKEQFESIKYSLEG